MVFLHGSLVILFSSSSSSTFPELFPSSPPGSYFNSGDNGAWREHHRKLTRHFSAFPFTIFSREPKLLKDSQGLSILIFLPERMRNWDSHFFPFFPKLKKHKYHGRRQEIDSFKATHHGFRLHSSDGIRTWKLFQETSIPFLKSLKGLLVHVEDLLLAFSSLEWLQQKKQIPQNFGLFGTFWTTVVHNPTFSEWHFDRKDFGLTALLYFGDFSGGELLLGNPFNFKVPIQKWDLLFLRSSAMYHRSLPFLGKRINLIFYSSVIKGKDIQLNTPKELQ